ncbi:hypothetical protein ATANTOWER_031739 [Ataeniobius toweri]|uniref:Uncharacterized protein n=1 Tax=Ataeniobius toweri TaxID=208326 RepID=A0ABU7BSA8_9TELE|nr:hypothetical protein [Ataeniobius toweri]
MQASRELRRKASEQAERRKQKKTSKHKTSLNQKFHKFPAFSFYKTFLYKYKTLVDFLTKQICHLHLRTNSGTRNIDSQVHLREYKTSIKTSICKKSNRTM